MPQCEGVNIYASGDYLVDERQGYLCTTIERLRAHMVTLKEKLYEEKMLLSELKAETRYLTMQQTDTISEDYNTDSYQSASESSLGLHNNIPNAGEMAKAKMPVEDSTRNLDRTEYMHRLREIDNLCKEEMARMNSVVEQMEPLKQMASDWMLETRLNEISGAPASKDGNPILEGRTDNLYQSEHGIEPASYKHPAFNGDVIVISPEIATPPIPYFMPGGKCDSQLEHSAIMEIPLIKSSKSKCELESKKEPQLKLDCLMKSVPHKNAAIATDRKLLLAKGKKETKSQDSSSEVSLSSLEALKEKNITLIEMTDKSEKKNAEEDWKSAGSGKTSKSAISLESIQRAFANHHKKRRQTVKSETSITNALSFIRKAQERRKNMSLEKNNDQKGHIKKNPLLAYLHPSAKKIVKNWVMVGKEDKKLKDSTHNKSERNKKCTLNIGRNKDAELSLCEDDVINKFLYDEEGYVYTPLFVSETEDECSDTNSVREN